MIDEKPRPSLDAAFYLAEAGVPLESIDVFGSGRSEIARIVFKEWHAKWGEVPGPVV